MFRLGLLACSTSSDIISDELLHFGPSKELFHSSKACRMWFWARELLRTQTRPLNLMMPLVNSNPTALGEHKLSLVRSC